MISFCCQFLIRLDLNYENNNCTIYIYGVIEVLKIDDKHAIIEPHNAPDVRVEIDGGVGLRTEKSRNSGVEIY